MKKKLALLFFYFLWLQGFAQLKKDDALLGAAFSYTLDKSGTTTADAQYFKSEDKFFNGTFKFGYFIKDGLAFGGLVSYAKRTIIQKKRTVEAGAEDISNYTTLSTLFSIGPFLRAYKLIADGKIAFFLQLSGNYQYGQQSGLRKGYYMGNPTRGKDPDGRVNGMVFALSPGFVWFIRSRLGLELSFGNLNYTYQVTTRNVKGSEISKQTSANLNSYFGWRSLNLGLCFYICQKKS